MGSKKMSEHLPTGVVEVWADQYKHKRPEFFHDDVHIIAFKNRARGKFYLYRAQPVIEHLKNWTGHLTWAKNDCDDTNGFIMQFYGHLKNMLIQDGLTKACFYRDI
jgi:hypothetical protein